jgi:hypothetical protein
MYKLFLVAISLVSIINSNAQNVGIGTNTPDSLLTVNGSANIQGTIKTNKLLITSGAGVNKVLQCDEAGNATWVTPTATSITYQMGLTAELGGYVFFLTPDGKHGLVVATQDQGESDWYEASNLPSIPANHNADGQKFSDWRLPTKYELNELFILKSTIGGFAVSGANYWSSTENAQSFAWGQNFTTGNQSDNGKSLVSKVRAVRSF